MFYMSVYQIMSQMGYLHDRRFR